MDGTAVEIVWNLLRVLFGLYVGTAAILGFSLMPMSNPLRWLYGLLAVGIVVPPVAFAAASYVNYVAVVAGIVCLLLEYLRRGAAGRAQATAKAS